jgi:arginase family enzyme
MDPSILFSTGTRVKGGLYTEETKKIMKLLKDEDIVNIDITELNLNIGNTRQKTLSLLNLINVFDDYLNIK